MQEEKKHRAARIACSQMAHRDISQGFKNVWRSGDTGGVICFCTYDILLDDAASRTTRHTRDITALPSMYVYAFQCNVC